MASIKYCLPITRFSNKQCHKLAIVVERALLPKLGFNRHMPKVVLYGPRKFGGKEMMHVHTEQTILHTEKFMAHIRGKDEIGDLQMILLNQQQLVCGAKDFLFQLPYSRYSYCEDNEVTFLWKELAALKIKLDIKGAWKPSLAHPMDAFIMENFIDKGYNKSVLEVLNDIRVYMQVSVVSDMSKNGNKMEKWALSAEVNPQSQWTWPPRRTPTRQNMKVWRDCLRGTFINNAFERR